MQDCSNCSNVVASGQGHFCKMGNNVYPISNYPEDGASCSTWTQGSAQKVEKEHSRDPLLSWLDRKKNKSSIDSAEQKIIDAYDKNMGFTETPQVNASKSKFNDGEVDVKNALGWIIAAVLSGVLISLWLLGFL
jgi:hypothetical protein